MNRWQRLLETKPVALVDHLLDEVAKLLAKDLSRWPLPITELDFDTGGAFAPLFAADSHRPARAVYLEAFRLADWELARETEAFDEYMRNRRFLERGLSPSDRSALLLLSRWLVEQMLSLGEATESRLKRPQLRDCLDRLRRRFEAEPVA